MTGRPPSSHLSIYVETGRRIRDARRAQHMSQERLAVAVGLSRTSITNIERGRQKLLLHTLSEIAGQLRIPIHDLVPIGRDITPALENQLPSDASPRLRKLITKMVQEGSSES